MARANGTDINYANHPDEVSPGLRRQGQRDGFKDDQSDTGEDGIRRNL